MLLIGRDGNLAAAAAADDDDDDETKKLESTSCWRPLSQQLAIGAVNRRSTAMVLAPATFSLSLSRGASPCCLEADSLESLLVSHDGRAALSKCVTAHSAIDAGRGCAPRAGESAFCAAAALCSMAAATATCIVDPRVEARDFPVDGCRRRLFFCFLLLLSCSLLSCRVPGTGFGGSDSAVGARGGGTFSLINRQMVCGLQVNKQEH